MKKKFKVVLCIFFILFNLCSCGVFTAYSTVVDTIQEENIIIKVGIPLLALSGIAWGLSSAISDNKSDIEVKNKIELNLNERLEIPFKIKNQKTREVLKITVDNSEIIQIISEKGGVILGKKAGKAKLRMVYAEVTKEIEVTVNDTTIQPK